MTIKKPVESAQELRQRAEERLAQQSPPAEAFSGELDAKRLLHELQVHQVELEMQREELQQAKADLLARFIACNKSNNELIESNERFEQLAELSGTVVWEVDDKGLFTYVNHVSKSVLGYHPDEMIGKMHFYDLHPETGRKEFIETTIKIFEKKEEFKNFENNIVAKDGHSGWVSTNGIPRLAAKGVLLGYSGKFTNITERVILTEQLIQSQKLETIGQLAGGLAHDLNNILSVINGYATLAKLDMTKDEEQFDYFNTILKATSRAAALTHGLLAYSRKQTMNKQHQDLNQLIGTVGAFIKRIIHENIKFTVSLQEAPLIVNVDTVQIEQVLLNLATNARDAMPEGGAFSIATSVEIIDEQYILSNGYGETGNYAVITATDTGQGMDAKTKLKVFDPFFTTKEVGKGTGLGLAMVMGIIKQHGGFVDLQSEPDKGSLFRIYLPLLNKEIVEVESVETEVLMVTAAGTTLLLAEDDPDTLAAMEIFLRRAGYKVITAVDGQDALDKFTRYKDEIKLVISDVVMPKKSGKAACDEMRLMSEKTKFIFVSGHTRGEFERDGEPVMDDVLMLKPLLPFELLSKIRELLV